MAPRKRRSSSASCTPLGPDVPVQIAHMAGWGNYDDPTDAALGTFAGSLEAGEIVHPQLLFDIAAVVVPISPAATVDPALVAEIRGAQDRLAARIRQIGPERVVYGTDWTLSHSRATSHRCSS